jgi:ribosome-associated toxin RatA of RatAB toxin-antitoxin module
MNYNSDDCKQKAKRLLVNYFEGLFQHVGVRWDSDNDAEIDLAVEYIITASILRYTEMSNLALDKVEK